MHFLLNDTTPLNDTTQLNDTTPLNDTTQLNDTTPLNDITQLNDTTLLATIFRAYPKISATNDTSEQQN